MLKKMRFRAIGWPEVVLALTLAVAAVPIAAMLRGLLGLDA